MKLLHAGRPGVVGRLLRFGIVGVIATVVHAAVALAVLRLAGATPVVANIVAFCVAVAVSFAGHARYTFGAHPSRGAALRFGAVALSSAALSTGLVAAAGRWTTMPPELYLPLVALCTPLLTFAWHSLWTFRSHRPVEE